MGVECKFDKNYVTSDWSLENITKRDLQTKSFLTPTVTPDPRSPGTPWPTKCAVWPTALSTA